jgi:nucleoside-diphosphate-sugar epimerase
MSFWHSRKVLVAGGCGFIGSYLVEQLVAAQAHVTVVDNLEKGTLDNIAPVADQVEFIQGDLRDRTVCQRVTDGFDVVMNLAARAYGLEYSVQHHGEMLYHNAVISLHMLEAARASGIGRFLVVSSSCVYPDDAETPTPELDVMTGMPEQVNEGYGWAKRIAELQAYYYSREYGMKIAIVRPFNPYGGRYQWAGAKSHVIPALVKRVMDGKDPLVVWGSGNQRRNFLHVRDTVQLMMLVTENYACGKPVNLGYEDDVSIADLVSLICEVSGRHPNVVFDTTKPEGRFRKCADATLLRKVTNDYQPKVDLRRGIEEMIEWYERTFQKS